MFWSEIGSGLEIREWHGNTPQPRIAPLLQGLCIPGFRIFENIRNRLSGGEPYARKR